jgi:hypothetical protein
VGSNSIFISNQEGVYQDRKEEKMARDVEDQKGNRRQKFQALGIFIFLFILLALVTYGFMACRFGWWYTWLGLPPSKGAFIPTPTSTPTVGAVATPTSESIATPTPVQGSGATGTLPSTNQPSTFPVSPLTVTSSYFSWWFAAWAGVIVYLLTICASRFAKIDEDPDTDFIKYTPWYIITFLRAPLLAMVVLWLLININLSLGTSGQGAVADFKTLPDIVLVAIAFVLGYYAVLCQKQLDIIIKAIFPKAWVMAEGDFVMKGEDIILLNDNSSFTTNPQTAVTWSTNVGTIDAKTGVYKASKDLKDLGKVRVTATLCDDTSISQTIDATLKLFRINKINSEKQDQEVYLSVDSRFPGIDLNKVAWTSDDVDLKKTTGSTTSFKAPKFEDKPKVHVDASVPVKQGKSTISYSEYITIDMVPLKNHARSDRLGSKIIKRFAKNKK